MQRILVTGAAGFIGAHTAAALARRGHAVLGCDNFDPYYPPAMKHQRVRALLQPVDVEVVPMDICDLGALQQQLRSFRPDQVLHLAAQAGVRHSFDAPMDYVQANLVGFASVLEACRQAGVRRVAYASSSSVYGGRHDAPFAETDRVDAPTSLYAATKAANELMAQAYARQHGLSLLGLRLFTVYGPWGRPDMAAFGFAQRMRRGQPITVFEGGRLQRDFTYIDDAVQAIVRLLELPRHTWRADAGVVNLGHQAPVAVIDLVRRLEAALGLKATLLNAPMPAGDVPLTCADDQRLLSLIGPWHRTPLAEGVQALADWLRAWDPLPACVAAAA